MRFSRLVDHRDMASLREPPEFTTKLSMSSSAHAPVGNGTSVEGKQTANHGDRPFRTVLVGLRRAHLFVRPSVGTYQRRSSDGRLGGRNEFMTRTANLTIEQSRPARWRQERDPGGECVKTERNRATKSRSRRV